MVTRNSNCLFSFLLLGLVLGCTTEGVHPLETRGVKEGAATGAGGHGSDQNVVLEVGDLPGWPLTVQVHLDGQPIPGVTVLQGGKSERYTADENGRATLLFDPNVPGDGYVMASHPEARVAGSYVSEGDTEVVIDLKRFTPVDNPEYAFREPGEPGNSLVLWECGHCHDSLNADFSQSVHSQAGSNPILYDTYLGRAGHLLDSRACEKEGGLWQLIPNPNGAGASWGCAVEAAVQSFGSHGECASCHAPGINGALKGRDLLEATGAAYEYGVHCDVCHHVESVDLNADSPGVGGALRILRPAEKPFSSQLGDWLPLTFGPNGDNVNANMGSVERPVFHESLFCAGCHEYRQEVVAGEVDLNRWPDGKLPVHSTYSEWESGPMNPAAPCQSCHMPPNPQVLNSADLQNFDPVTTGVVAGWVKPAGSTRRHTWPGPRTEGGEMLKLAAALYVETEVEDNVLETRVEVKNVGPGHAIPTGEPLRSMVVVVDATCDGEALPVLEGPAVPDYGGAHESREADEDWSSWPHARTGDKLRVIRVEEEFVEYSGPSPFDGLQRSPKDQGIPKESVVGESTVLGFEGETVVLDRVLPEGDRVYRTDGLANWNDGGRARRLAGAPGFGFARVMVDEMGRRMVPHYLAVDIASDNRLMPQSSFLVRHRFATSCPDPEVVARLVYRAFPPDLAEQRGWDLKDQWMVEVKR